MLLAALVPASLLAQPDIRISPLTLSFTQQQTDPIYLEIDWMESDTHSHKPSPEVVERIASVFAAAGYTIHIDVSNAIPHQNVLPVLSAGGPSGSPAVQAILAEHFDHAADSRYYYSIWGHNFSIDGSFTTSSGIADLPGRVHLVTLGSFGQPAGSFNIPFSYQVGTLIHEFGHNLNQRHGGGDHTNYKPNYLSVMNYHYQLAGLGPTLLAKGLAHTASGFDDFSYSHGLLPSLNENNLDETAGIGLGRAVDWNCNGTLQTGVAKDIQASNWCTAVSGRSVLNDFDNWSTLQVRTDSLRPEPAGPPEICVTAEEHRPLAERIEALRAQGLLPPDGPEAYPAPDKSAAGQSFQIWNDGNETLEITGLALDTATSWIHWAPQAPFTVAPGKSQQVLVYADLGDAPAGKTTRRLLVQSNDPDESPYPGGVNLVINGLGPIHCHELTLSATGSGDAPVATPANSPICSPGHYHAGQPIQLAASPAEGWQVAGWSGTDNDAGTSTGNSLTMPANPHAVSVTYTEIPTGPTGLSFFTVPPCRILDTRSGASAASGEVYGVEIAGICGIPTSAVAVAANVTIVGASGSGFLSLWPADLPQPLTSTLNFRPGQVRANNAVLQLATDGRGEVSYTTVITDNGSVHLLIDVAGYFSR